MRIRSVKPEFWEDERLSRLSHSTRLLFIGLWCIADEEGRLRGSPLFIRAQVFPYDLDVDVASALAELERAGRIVQYAHEGESFIWICNFRKHQKTDPRLKSKLPAPPKAAKAEEKSEPTDSSHPVRTQSAPDSHPVRTDFPPIGAGNREQVSGNREQVDPAGAGDGADAPEPPEALQLHLDDPKRKPADEVLSHYVEAMKANGFEVHVTPKRRDLVQKRLREGFTVEVLKQAINGLTWSDFHMGKDPKTSGQSYTDLKYAIGDAGRIEANCQRAANPPQPQSKRAAGWL